MLVRMPAAAPSQQFSAALSQYPQICNGNGETAPFHERAGSKPERSLGRIARVENGQPSDTMISEADQDFSYQGNESFRTEMLGARVIEEGWVVSEAHDRCN